MLEKSSRPGVAAPATPRPAFEMKDLRALVGTWTTEETYEASALGPAGTGTGTNTTRPGPGGFSVLMDQRSNGPWGNFVGHGIYTWDPEQGVFKIAWVD